MYLNAHKSSNAMWLCVIIHEISNLLLFNEKHQRVSSLSQHHLLVTIASTPGYHGNYISLLLHPHHTCAAEPW
jgi:hypothetical protein